MRRSGSCTRFNIGVAGKLNDCRDRKVGWILKREYEAAIRKWSQRWKYFGRSDTRKAAGAQLNLRLNFSGFKVALAEVNNEY